MVRPIDGRSRARIDSAVRRRESPSPQASIRRNEAILRTEALRPLQVIACVVHALHGLGAWPKTRPTAQWWEVSSLRKAFLGLGWDGQAVQKAFLGPKCIFVPAWLRGTHFSAGLVGCASRKPRAEEQPTEACIGC